MSITVNNFTSLDPSLAHAHAELAAGSELWLMPPMVDLCARLREPGHQQHGTLQSEGSSALACGFMHVTMPPDTDPVLQSGPLLKGLREKALADGGVHLHLLGALTQDLKGEKPSNMAGLKQGGCVGLTNVRFGFNNDRTMLQVLEYAATFDLPVFFYPDEPSLSAGGVAHEGFIASKHGLTGIPWIAETIAVAKAVLMVEETGVRAHFSQLSCEGSVELIGMAKSKGLPVTADVAMHQLFLTDDLIEGFNPLAHVLPPLRGFTDQKALREGLKSGVIDAICSHHEPLSATAKDAPFPETKPGISAFDTFLPLGVRLVAEGVLSAEQLVKVVSTNPAQIIGVDVTQDWLLVDPDLGFELTADSMTSKGKNTPFLGQKLSGKILAKSF